MKALGTFLGIVFSLALLAALGYGIYLLFKYAADLFGFLDPQLQAITVIISMVALFCALIIAGGLKAHHVKEANSHVVAQKIDLYEQLIVYWCSQLKKQADGAIDIDCDFGKLEQQLVLHGSAKVIATYMNLRRLSKQEGISDAKVSELLNKLIQEMREDMGRTDWNLKDNELLDLLLGRH